MIASVPETKSSSRRALLAGALGGLGAVVASAISRASPVAAATGDNMIVGYANIETSFTEIQNSVSGDTGLYVSATGNGKALWANANDGTAIYAQGSVYGVSAVGTFGPA